MRIIIFIMLFVRVLFSNEGSCYSVQLVSISDRDVAQNSLSIDGYPQECKWLHINREYTLRCQCESDYKKVATSLKNYKMYASDAIVVSTYTYHFDTNQTAPESTNINEVKSRESGVKKYFLTTNMSPDILKLTLDVMLYSGDLKNAYLIAKRGVERFPNELYWNNKMAQIALWSNRPSEALDYYVQAYQLRSSKELRQKIQMLASQTQNQDIGIKMLEDSIRAGEETNTTKLAELYKLSGRIEDGVHFFDSLNAKHPCVDFQATIIDLLLVNQEYEKAQERYDVFIPQYGTREVYDLQFAKAAFLQKNLPKALMYLRRNASTVAQSNEEYWNLYIDILWLSRDFDELYDLLLKRWKLGLLRPFDREILSALAPSRDKKVAAKVALESFTKDAKVYGFFSFAYIAKELNDIGSIQEALSKLTVAEQKLLETQSEYWIILADLEMSKKHEEQANSFYLKALSLNPTSVAVNQAYGWFLLDSGRLSALHVWLQSIDKLANRSDYAMILATAYLRLQNSEKSKIYFNMVAHNINADPQIYLLYSDILTLMGEKEASNKYQFIAWKKYALIVQKEGIKGINAEGLQAYLRLGMQFEPEKSLQWTTIAHENLTQEQYQNFLLGVSIMTSSEEATLHVKHFLRKSEPWLEFYLAFAQNDTEQMNASLQEHSDELPIADRVQAAYQLGNKPLAEELGFQGLEENPMNDDLASLMHGKWMENANNFRIQNDYQDRDRLIGKNISLLGTYELYKGWELQVNGRKRWQSSGDKDLYKEVPNDEAFSVGIAKKFGSFNVLSMLGEHQNINNFLFGELSGAYSVGRLIFSGGYFYHEDADESPYTMLAGYKDSIELKSTYQLTGSLQLALDTQQLTYFGSDGVAFAQGSQYSLSAIKKFRSAYPDLGIEGTLNYCSYKEDTLKKGVILDVLPADNIKILPTDYLQPTINLFYGLTGKEIVTKRWRPYGMIGLSYNSDTHDIGYNFLAGICGMFIGQDALCFEGDYASSYNSIAGDTQKYSLIYHLYGW